MIPKALLTRIKAGTCAVGYLRKPHDVWKRDPWAPVFRVTGTGFLVAPGVALTNRHVALNTQELIKKEGLQPERGCLQFLGQLPNGNLRMFMAQVIHFGWVAGDVMDLGTASFSLPDDPSYAPPAPLTLASSMSLSLGDPIATFGYPFGSGLLQRDQADGSKRVYRLGPVLQQGFVSAVAPFDESPSVERLLLDIRTAGGMSGSPVFSPTTGEVFGIHDAGVDATTAFAIPLTASRLAPLIAHAVSPQARAPTLIDFPPALRQGD